MTILKNLPLRRFGALCATLILLNLGASQSAVAQTPYKIGSKETVMTLNGTSTLHDWSMSAHMFSCDASFDVSDANQLVGLKSFTLTLPVHNLKGESSGLNNNAYSALKADTYKNMVFKLTGATVSATGAHTDLITATGNMTIAGVTKAITTKVASVVNDDGTITCTGTIPLKMSDYGVKRPSFMLGTMNAGDALTLKYVIMLVK